MALTVNTNIASLTAQRNLTGSQDALSMSLQRLSSGLRINSAKDDAAGLAISERFTAQIRGLNQGVRNANDGISLAQTAEGALKEVSSNLQRIRELAVQSANATNSASDRTALQAEVAQLVAEIDRVAQNTKFNGIALLDGSFTSKAFQVGADANETVSITSINSARTSAIGGSFSSATTSGAVGNNVIDQSGNAVTINGVNVVSTVGDGVSTDGTSNTSAKAKAAAINATAGTGVTATATTTITGGTTNLSTNSAADGDTITLTINGQNTTFTTSDVSDASVSRDEIAAGINLISGVTGVTATNNGQGITLTAADGRNILIAAPSHSGSSTDDLGDVGINATGGGVVRGTLSLTSTSSLGIQVVDSTGAIGSISNQNAVGSGVAISNATVATVSGANEAITAVDNALSTISSIRSDLGSYQSRFESVVANLQTTAENLSASRSRIVDADFAAETANLTKAQILQQSGIAMLAQANAIPQNVLALLQ
jgi:flagellin